MRANAIATNPDERNGTVPILNPVNTVKRTRKVANKSANSKDREHYFPDIVDNYVSNATRFSTLGGDKVIRDLYQIEGSLVGRDGEVYDGVFEWLVGRLGPNATTNYTTHRRFVIGGNLTGVVNKSKRPSKK